MKPVAYGCLLGVLVPLDGSKLLVHLRALDERVQDVQDTVATPSLGIISQRLYLLVALCLFGHTLPVGAKAVELVDELIDDIPSPVVLKAQSISLVRIVQPSN